MQRQKISFVGKCLTVPCAAMDFQTVRRKHSSAKIATFSTNFLPCGTIFKALETQQQTCRHGRLVSRLSRTGSMTKGNRLARHFSKHRRGAKSRRRFSQHATLRRRLGNSATQRRGTVLGALLTVLSLGFLIT